MVRYADPAFELGMALGNAYGNMWAANAQKRQKEKANKIIEDMMGGVTNEDVNTAINAQPSAVTADSMRQKLLSNNINQKVIDEIMPGYEKQIKQRAFENLMPGIMDNYNAGKFTDALKGVAELRKYDTDMANILLKDVYAAARDNRIYNRNRADRLSDIKAEREYKDDVYYRNRADKQADAAQERAHKEKLAGLKLGGNGGSGQLTQQINAAKALINDRANWIKNHTDFTGNVTEVYPYEAQAEKAVEFLAGTYGYKDDTKSPDTLSSAESSNASVSDNYDKLMNEWQTGLARNKNADADVRWSKQQLIEYAKKKYGADAEAIIKNTDWESFGF